MHAIVELDFMPKGLSVCAFKGSMEKYSSRRLHRHPCHEILLIRNGISLLIDPSWRQPLLGRCMALIPSGVAHRSLVVGKGLEYSVLFVHKRLYSPPGPEIRIFRSSELGLALFNRLCSASGVDRSRGVSGECLRLFLRILGEDRKDTMVAARLPEAKDPLNMKVASYLQKNFGLRITPAELEKVVHYSARHISRRFSREMGMGVIEYLRIQRILMASVMLSDRSRKITDIAFACGYGSLSSFYRDFQSFFGVSPKVLREEAA